MRIGILTGGGDVPGLNPCIRAVALSAIDRGWQVIGFRRGWQSFLQIDPGAAETIAENSVLLDREAVRGIDRLGGTILHSSRLDPRTEPEGDRTAHVLAVLEAMGIAALIVTGGDGTLRFAAHLSAAGFPVISIPKTMDNDINGTDYSIGFSTAVTRSVEAINALRTTTESHERIAVIELFGRRSGATALLAGFLAQADRTLIAEVPVDLDRLIPLLAADRAARPARYAICVVSEGATFVGQDAPDVSTTATQRSSDALGQRLARAIEARTGTGTVYQALAYLMRAGEPDALDRMVAFAFGALAVRLIERGTTGRMVTLTAGSYGHVPIDTLLDQPKRVDVARLYDVAAYRPAVNEVQGMPMFLY